MAGTVFHNFRDGGRYALWFMVPMTIDLVIIK